MNAREERSTTKAAPAGDLWAIAIAASAAWIAAVLAISVRQGVRPDLDALAAILGLALGPVALIWAAAWLAVDARRLAAETRRARALADSMLAPALAAAGEASAVVVDIRREVEALEARVQAAAAQLSTVSQDLRRMAETETAAAQTQIDELAQAAFAAGRTANQVFEARMADARALVERSAGMVAEAADLGSTRLAAATVDARAAMVDLGGMIAEIETRAGRLPDAMRDQADQVRSAVARGLSDLAVQARRTGDEAAAVDEALQARLRRNFEMLSETVRLMGMVAAATPAPRPPELEGGPAESPAEPAAIAFEEEAVDAARAGPRLKLEPTDRDRALAAVFAAPTGASSEPLTWSDLLAAITEGEPAAARDQAAAALEVELAAMGVDAAAVPATGLAEALSAARDDLGSVRAWMRRLAPTQVRRIERRIQIDAGLRAVVEPFLARQRTRLAQAPDRAAVARQLGSADGRLFLLFDAAAENVA